MSVGRVDGRKISLRNQPAKPPDLNVLDLGFFNDIQSSQQEACPIYIQELVAVVAEALDELPPDTLKDTFVTLLAFMRETL